MGGEAEGGVGGCVKGGNGGKGGGKGWREGNGWGRGRGREEKERRGDWMLFMRGVEDEWIQSQVSIARLCATEPQATMNLVAFANTTLSTPPYDDDDETGAR